MIDPINYLKDRTSTLLGVIFLFTLPIPGTVTIRLFCLFVGAVFAALLMRREEVRDIPLKSVFLTWFLVAGFSLFYAIDPVNSLREIKTEIVYALLAYFLFYTQTRSTRDWYLWIGTITLGVVMLSVTAVWLWFTIKDAQSQRFIYNGVGAYTTYLITTLPFVIFLLFQLPLRTPWRWIVRGTPLLVLFPIYLTQNRTVWIALSAIAITLTLLLAGKSRRLSRQAAALKVLALFLAITSWMLYSSLEHRVTVNHDPNDIIDITVQHDPRRPLWNLSLNEILSQPITGAGYGIGSGEKIFAELRQKDANLGHAHNIFLNAGIQMGIPGIIVMVFIFAAVIHQYWRLYQSNHRVAQWLAACGIAMVFGVLTRNMTDDFFHRDLALLFWSLVGASLGYGSRLVGKK